MKQVLMCSIFAVGLAVLALTGTASLPIVSASEACNSATVETNHSGPTNVGAAMKGTYRVSGTTGKGDCDQTLTRANFTNRTGFGCQAGTYLTNPERCESQWSNTTSATAKWDAPCNSGNVYGVTQHYGWDGSNWHSYLPAAILLGTQCAPPPPEPGEPPCDVYGDWDPEAEQYVCISPIIIATGRRNPYTLTSQAHGVLFDLDADGDLDQVAWTDGDSDTAFLATDRNNNGVIDNGQELWGDKTLPNQPHGFAALVQWSLMTRGGPQPFIDEQDRIFDRLLLWEDRNHNGISERSELKKFSQRFKAISLAFERIQQYDQFGNKFAVKGWVQRYNGELETVYDVFLPTAPAR